jgi:hypothetical protein
MPHPLSAFVAVAGGGHTRRAERGMGGGVNIFEDERNRLPSYSNYLSTKPKVR